MGGHRVNWRQLRSQQVFSLAIWQIWNRAMPPSALPKWSWWTLATFMFLESNSVSLLLMRYLNSRFTTSSNLKAAFARSFSSHSVLSNPISDEFTIILAFLSGTRVVGTSVVLAGGVDEADVLLLLDIKVLKFSRQFCCLCKVNCFNIWSRICVTWRSFMFKAISKSGSHMIIEGFLGSYNFSDLKITFTFSHLLATRLSRLLATKPTTTQGWNSPLFY